MNNGRSRKLLRIVSTHSHNLIEFLFARQPRWCTRRGHVTSSVMTGPRGKTCWWTPHRKLDFSNFRSLIFVYILRVCLRQPTWCLTWPCACAHDVIQYGRAHANFTDVGLMSISDMQFLFTFCEFVYVHPCGASHVTRAASSGLLDSDPDSRCPDSHITGLGKVRDLTGILKLIVNLQFCWWEH